MSTIRAIRAEDQDRRLRIRGEWQAEPVVTRRTARLDPRPQHDGLEQERPRSFRVRPLDVLAIAHDGSADRARALARWVNADRDGGSATAYIDQDGVTVLIHVNGEPTLLRVRAAQYLIRTRHAATRWRAYDAAEFETLFTPRPREVPIFDDGEVA